jgi:hypothetical protein
LETYASIGDNGRRGGNSQKRCIAKVAMGLPADYWKLRQQRPFAARRRKSTLRKWWKGPSDCVQKGYIENQTVLQKISQAAA